MFEAVITRGESARCPACKGSSLTKLLSPPPVIFKGSGFYSTEKHLQKTQEQAKKSESPPKEPSHGKADKGPDVAKKGLAPPPQDT